VLPGWRGGLCCDLIVRSKKKRAIIAGISLLAAMLLLCVVAFLVVRRYWENRLIVENRSGFSIVHITVTISNSVVTSNVITFDNITPGRKMTASYTPRGDSSFHVVGELADGTKFGGSFGYTTNGMNRERTYVMLMPDGEIKFEQDWD
jgi:hypothetical protein